MNHNHEIHGNLARLLATENLNIEHKNIETAMFDVSTRTLTLPIWEHASDTAYQLLIGHEAAHAIFTPNVDIEKVTKAPHGYVNVVEDARIEKLMKRKYPGLKKIFYSAYEEFCKNDFFELKGKDISTLNFADKVNIYFKCSNYYKQEFTQEEKQIINLISDAETFDEVIHASEVLYEYCKKDNITSSVTTKVTISQNSTPSSCQSSNTIQISACKSDGDSQSTKESSGESDDGLADQNETLDTKNSEEGNSDSQKETETEMSSSASQRNEVISTMQALERSVKSLVSQHRLSDDLVYLTIPQLNLDSIIVKNKNVHDCLIRHWGNSLKVSYDSDYLKFKKSAQKEVNYLVKEFECKKAAEAYSRSSESKSGILDTNLLYSYKFNNDIFKKITTVMDGKNHGLMFILDWSGSMDDIMLDTCKQLYNLIWFCKKVSIPFEVYAFTTNWQNTGKQYEPKNNTLGLYGRFNLLNIISSRVNSFTLDLHMKHIYRIASHYKSRSYNYGTFNIPNGLCLSGTPLNESLLALHKIIPEFKNKTRVDKVQCVVLTDGECSDLPMHITRPNAHGLGTTVISNNCYLRDLKLKTTYKFSAASYYSNESHKFTNVLLRNLRDNFPTVNFIGIRLLSNYEYTSFIKKYSDGKSEEYFDQWKKTKSCSIKTIGYHTYFGIASSSLSENSEFEVSDNASSDEIKTAFKKTFTAKKTNKKILSDFIDLIA